MLNAAFTVKLEQQVLSGLVTAGYFDGKAPSLACATTGGKILLHSPHDSYQESADKAASSIRYLNLNRKITALGSGSFNASGQDLLFVGTQSNLLAYNILRNTDQFFVDVQDGVNSLLLGDVTTANKPRLVAGGNCSVLGFDEDGGEAFWTVTGDNVSSLALCDVDSQGSAALLVGSDDFEIRVFRNEELLCEITEADKVTFLSSLGEPPAGQPGASTNRFAYGLANGTVGVYSGSKTRMWRVKTKNKVTALHTYDLDMDGNNEVFTGWSNGSFTVRRQETGEVIFKDSLDAPVAGIVSCDYRQTGSQEVLLVSESGEVRAYMSTDVDFGALHERGFARDNLTDQKALGDLQKQKLDLTNELRKLEKSLKSGGGKPGETPVASLPSSTSLSYSVEADMQQRAVMLKVEVSTDAQIVNLIAVDLEGAVLLGKEVVVISPKAQSRTATLPIVPRKNAPCSLRIQTHIAARSLLSQLHVFEHDVKLPRFAAFKYLDNQIKEERALQKQSSGVKSGVRFFLDERAERVVSWMQTAFLSGEKIGLAAGLAAGGGGEVSVHFIAVCDTLATGDGSMPAAVRQGSALVFQLKSVKEGGKTQLSVVVQCESMELAAEVVQDMSAFLKVTELRSEADFEAELDHLETLTQRVAECNAARLRLAADMADDSQRIKALVIRAEDSRLMLDMPHMRQAYTELNALNAQLVGGYKIRAGNHELLLATLKEVNQMIQKAANLRAGAAKARVIADSRAAVKTNNMTALFKIFKMGHDSL